MFSFELYYNSVMLSYPPTYKISKIESEKSFFDIKTDKFSTFCSPYFLRVFYS